MRDRADVIYQATLFDGQWVGHADFLIRTDRPSALGDWSYDIADTKLARRLKVPALLPMATYALRVTELQGIAPGRLVVVTGDKVEHPWRLSTSLPTHNAAARPWSTPSRHRQSPSPRPAPNVPNAVGPEV